MRLKLLLLSLSLCIQTEGQAAVKEFVELGYSVAKSVVYHMKRPGSALPFFQHHPTQQFSLDTTSPVRLNARTYSSFIQKRNMSTLNERVSKFASTSTQEEKDELTQLVKTNCISMSNIQDTVLRDCSQRLKRLDTPKRSIRELHAEVNNIDWIFTSRLKEMGIINNKTGDFEDNFEKKLYVNIDGMQIESKKLKEEFENIFTYLRVFFLRDNYLILNGL